jgi:inhibitor of cysteine peptidase
MELGKADAGQVRDAVVGDEITLRLAENPSTGFRWTEPEHDPTVLKYLGSEYQSGGIRPGAAGTRIMRFRAVTPGRTRIRLRSVRPTVPGAPGESDYEVSINVT